MTSTLRACVERKSAVSYILWINKTLNILQVTFEVWRDVYWSVHYEFTVKSQRETICYEKVTRWHSEREHFYDESTTSSTTTQCAPEATEFGEITQNKGHLIPLITSFKSLKVTDFGTNRKLICDFLLVISD